MAPRGRSPWPYRIAPRAWRAWEALDIPVLLPDAIDALLALPPAARSVRRIVRPPVVLTVLAGTVFGHRLEITGAVDGHGRWREVHRVFRIREGG